jgi:putative spermidine/putrescine transport system permease protein
MRGRFASRRNIGAFALIAPLAVALLLNFLGPIAVLLTRGFQERELPAAWPKTTAALRHWSGTGLPDEGVVTTLVGELKSSQTSGALSSVANRLNYDLPGLRTLLFNTARALPLPAGTAALQSLRRMDGRWGERATWAAMKHATGPGTTFYLLAALDRRLDADGKLISAPAAQAVFIDVFGRTFAISAIVTLLCVGLGYPVAYLLADLPPRLANPLLILVLLPFWTSVLVRSMAWMVLLQDQGILNHLLMRLGVIARPLQLIYNRVGVCIAMTHVLLPYFLLPLYAVMKRIPPATTRAALSLGARPGRAFWTVYFPQTLPGVTAGALIVFILALGYYITPALLGGAGDQMISYFIAYYTDQVLNWGMAASLSLVLLAATLVLVTLYGRAAGARQLALR